MEASDVQVVIVQETQPPLGAGDEQEGADAASGHRSDTADDDDQQDDQYFRQADFAQKQRVNEHHCFIGFRSLRGGVSASAQM